MCTGGVKRVEQSTCMDGSQNRLRRNRSSIPRQNQPAWQRRSLSHAESQIRIRGRAIQWNSLRNLRREEGNHGVRKNQRDSTERLPHGWNCRKIRGGSDWLELYGAACESSRGSGGSAIHPNDLMVCRDVTEPKSLMPRDFPPNRSMAKASAGIRRPFSRS